MAFCSYWHFWLPLPPAVIFYFWGQFRSLHHLQEDDQEAGSGAARCSSGGCDDCGQGPPVIVVGAGLAGLAAAQTLLRAGCAAPVVLEAGPEAGGRAKTFREGGPFEGLERGAHWVHGGEDNVVLSALLRFFNLSQVWVGGDDMFEGSPARHTFIRNGRADPETRDLSFERYAHVDDEVTLVWLRELLSERGADVSREQVWRLGISELVNLTETERELVDWQLRVRTEQRSAAPLDALGVRVADLASYSFFYPEEDSDSPQPPQPPRRGDAIVRGGFGGLVRSLSAGLDVRLNSRVQAISYSSSGVVVHTANDTFSGSAVIVTPSVGVLQSGAVRFSPDLPPEKLAAVLRLQMGQLAKVFIKFRAGLSPINQSSYLITKLIDPGQLQLVYYCICDSAAGSCKDVLECQVAGPKSLEAERLARDDPAALRSHVFGELRELFPEIHDDAIETIHVEAWTSNNPLYGGAWSSGKVGSSSHDFEALAAPLGRLRFAGEATCRLMYGTTHAAVVSGARAAAELVREARGVLPDKGDWPLFNESLLRLCDELPASRRGPLRNRSACKIAWPDLGEQVASQFASWDAMPAASRREWQALRWSRSAWRGHGVRIPPLMSKPWEDLPVRAQIAAQRLGYTELLWSETVNDQASILVCRRRPKHYLQPWDRMENRVQTLWLKLGFNRVAWDEEGQKPQLDNVSWFSLERDQRLAAMKLGYRHGFW